MKKSFAMWWTSVPVAMLAVLPAHGQTNSVSTNDAVQPIYLEQKRPASVNRVNLAYRMGLNITADFKKLGGYTNFFIPLTGSAVDRNYDNGYNKVDSSGNAGGMTWNWGYSSSSSVQGNSLVLSSSTSPSNVTSKDNSDDPQQGFEVSYDHEFYRDPKHGWRFGLEGGLGYTRLTITDSQRLTATINRIMDTYSIPGGVVVPPAPYNGTFNGPGPVIGSQPDPVGRTTTNIVSGATIVGERTLDSNIFGFRVGPYAEYPINDRFSVLFSGGLYLVVGQTDFSFRETVDIPGVGTQFHSGSSSQTDVLVGGYVGANVEYALTKDVGVFVGAQFQGAGESVNHAKGKESVLNLSESVVVSIGASYSF